MQGLSNSSRRRLREVRLTYLMGRATERAKKLELIHESESAETQDVSHTSTFKASYMPHDVKTARATERGEYVKNKGKAGKGGDWWGHVETKFEANSCYRDSFKEHDYAQLRSGLSDAGRKSLTNAGAQKQTQQVDMANFRNKWFEHRMRKPPADDPGKHYDILTGRELNRVPFQARRVARLSGSKMGEKEKRNYNIISNAPITA
ncbi:hypothetical protein HDV05_007471 [Chytridiales sp. JEL 0842]|nr:hypothetical protein HDV05_007471 [Chytridiales sp. JEL 0842]